MSPAPGRSTLPPSYLRHALGVLALACICWAPYSNSLTGDFVYDSRPIIQEDERLASPRAAIPLAGEIWTSHYWHSADAFYDLSYRPLTTLSYALNYWPLAYSQLTSAERARYKGALSDSGIARAPALPPLSEAAWQKARQPFHFVNWLYHFANVLLLYLIATGLLRRATPRAFESEAAAEDANTVAKRKNPAAAGAKRADSAMWIAFTAFIASALFAVHPVNTEAVTNLVGRADLQATLFVMLGLLAHLRAYNSAGRSAAAWSTAAAVALLLGLLSKESAIVLVGLVAALDFALAGSARPGTPSDSLRSDPLHGERSWRAATLDLRGHMRSIARRYVPYAIAIAIFFIARARVFANLDPGFVDGLNNPLVDHGFLVSKLTALKALGQQFLLLAWPAKLSPDYSFDAIQLFDLSAGFRPSDLYAVVALAILAAMLALVVRLRHRQPLLAWSLAAGAMALAPTSNLVVEIGTIMGERFLYLPGAWFSLATALIVALGLAHWLSPHTAPVLRRGAPPGRLLLALFVAAAVAALILAIGWRGWWSVLPPWLNPDLPDRFAAADRLSALILANAWILPVVFLGLLLREVWSTPAARGHKLAVAAVVLVVGAVLHIASLRTFARNFDWQTRQSLWTAAVQVVPRSAKAQGNYANAIIDRVRYTREEIERSIEHAEIAWGIRNYPGIGADLSAFYLLETDLLLRSGKTARPAAIDPVIANAIESAYTRAVEVLRAAIEDDRHNWVGVMRERLRRLGRPYIMSKANGNFELYQNLGIIFVRTGRFPDAIPVLRHCVALDPLNEGCRIALAESHIALAESDTAASRDQLDQAAATLLEVITLDDSSTVAGALLAYVYGQLAPGQRILNVEAASPGFTSGTSVSALPRRSVRLVASAPMVSEHVCRALANLVSQFAGAAQPERAATIREAGINTFGCSRSELDTALSNASAPSLSWRG